MNKKADFPQNHPPKAMGSCVHARVRRSRRAARAASPDAVSREAGRLLKALCAPGADAVADPSDENALLLRRRRGGISLGGGRFSRDSARALVREDLAAWSPDRRLEATEAGRSRRRREEAGGADPFLHQHVPSETRRFEGEDGMFHARVDAEESPLDWLRRRKDREGRPLIDEACYEAGERLRRDITLAGLLPGVTARWDAMPKGGPGSPSDATDRMVAARQRLDHAFAAVGGDFADLLLDLCGFLKGLERIEQERGWPARSAKVVVRLALARLAEHYGFGREARGPHASRGIRAWQAQAAGA